MTGQVRRLCHQVALGSLALLLVAGCAKKPAVPAAQFVGVWVAVPEGQQAAPEPGRAETITLLPDGKAMRLLPPNPHAESYNWLLRGDSLVLADPNGTGAIACSYRFNGRDELVLSTQTGQQRYQRAKAGLLPPGSAGPRQPVPAGR